ncbi:hypothetical protein CDAR_102441 [Caerostris darwini]|uniref:Uncharacterized protein n=1 Tax=Caerostris darwini TaxID=1538125 RepID=A0AAV4QL43_9ARAC|nr:hypothetical protein CDAR_102441 [Caerostris darwini]
MKDTAQVNNTIQAFPLGLRSKGPQRSIPVISKIADSLTRSRGNCIGGVVNAFAVNLLHTTQRDTQDLIFLLEEKIQYCSLNLAQYLHTCMTVL